MTLLEVHELSKVYHSRGRIVTALDGVSLSLDEGECMAVLGETGSGKSTLGRMILGIEEPDEGTIRFRGDAWAGGWRNGRSPHRLDIQPVFQNPQQSLNPRRRVIDVLRISSRARGARVTDSELIGLLHRVGLRPVEKYLRRYPRELSGGELQRVAIARALSVRPSLIVADEPTSALDVSIRAGVLNLLRDLQQEGDVAILLITHDIMVARAMSTNTIVMKRGRAVDRGESASLLHSGANDPYTERLIRAIPELPSQDDSQAPMGNGGSIDA